MNIKPIKTENEYQAVMTEIDALLDVPEDSPEEERLELLSILVEAYEDQHYPIAPPDPIEAIKFHMEQNGLTRKDLELYIGPRQRVSDILNRKRPLSLHMIRRLHSELGIPAEILIRESSLMV